MPLNRLLISAVACALLLLAACSPKNDGAPAANAKPPKQEVTVEAVTANTKGFAVGAMLSATTVYVFFDPQCPHCGHLWQASIPLQKKVRFVWIPVAWISASSMAQAAALLTAKDPFAMMTEHEASILAGTHGIAATASVAPDIEQSIKGNTKMLNGFGAESVPFLVAKSGQTGQVVQHEGAMSTVELAALLGIDASL